MPDTRSVRRASQSANMYRRIRRVGLSMATVAGVTAIPSVRVGDIATTYGTDGKTTQSVPDVARMANTASTELLCAIGKRVPRFYLP